MRVMLFIVICFFTSVTHAEIRQGSSCDLPTLFATDGKTPTPWRNPPKDCKKYRVIAISEQLPQAAAAALSSNPTCANTFNSPSFVSQALQVFMAGAAKDKVNFAKLSASLYDTIGRGVSKGIFDAANKQGGDIAAAVSRGSIRRADDQASCTTLAAVIPAEAKVVGYRLVSASLEHGPLSCGAGAECKAAKFMATPAVVKKDGAQAVWVEYKQWSAHQSQTGRMLVFYELPEGKEGDFLEVMP